ncbi:MAG TPA: phosphate ABC transporter permease subunit PstC, partial [Fimbriimonadaceae bacterium]|nr:phosphate ABC transporter permease subunit PstC [Fimbriimonadaceae bacterium]
RLFADTALTRHRFGFEFLTKSVWDVPHEIYGASTFIYGTLLASALALVIAVPLSIGAALFLTEVAPRWLATPVAFLIDLLAAVPSIIYGLWGLLVLCPFVLKHVSPFLVDHLGANPLFVGPARLNNVLVAGLILAIMITPIITAVSREVIKTVPPASREASVGLGATRWETIRRVILPEARSGITGAVILGLGRAIGETMAVVMVIGNTPQIKASLVQPGYTMPALLANEFNEAFNVPLQLSALLEVALILFVVTLIVNASAQLLLTLTKQHITGKTERFPALSDFARNGMDLLGRYAFSVIVIGLLGLQVVSDFRAYGPGALGRGFEIMLVAAVLVTAFVRFLSSKAPMVKWRSVVDKLMRWTLSVSAFVACFAFGTLLVYVAMRGAHGINLDLFTKLPTPAGVPGGGLKSAILGTLELVLIASAIGIPAGLLSGVFVAEFHWHRLGALVRFAADVLNGIPSVVIGLFAYAAFVLPFGHFSAWAGGAALAIMMVPTVARTTEEILKLVPSSYREASAGLGAKKV